MTKQEPGQQEHNGRCADTDGHVNLVNNHSRKITINLSTNKVEKGYRPPSTIELGSLSLIFEVCAFDFHML